MDWSRRFAIVPLALFGGIWSGLAFAQQDDVGGSFFEPFNKLDLEERWFASDGWSNGSHQRCEWREDNLSVSGGRLVLQLGEDEADRTHTCAELQTRAIFGHGTYEISMRPVSASGTVSAFFTFIGSVHEKPHGEIDFEFLGRDPTEIQLNYFVEGEGGNEVFVPAGNGDADGFIKLAFEWSETRIRWFVDGEFVSETAPGANIPADLQKIYISFWSGTEEVNGWLGPFDESHEPSAMEIEWVAYTVPGENCRFPASVTCSPMAQ